MEKELISIGKYIGAPYKENSYDGISFDCYSLIYFIYKENNINLPKKFVNTSFKRINKEIINDLSNWVEVPYNEKKFLDVLLFRTSKRLKTHIGMVINKEFFIHTTQDTGVILGKFKKNLFLGMLYKVYRWHTLSK